MGHISMLVVGIMLTASLFACSGDDNSSPTTPTEPGGGGGGTTGGGTGGTQAPAAAAVTLGDIFFRSDHNGSSNPAVDTVAVGGTVTWTRGSDADMPHSVQSPGSPSFTSSNIMTGSSSWPRRPIRRHRTRCRQCRPTRRRAIEGFGQLR